MMAYIIHILSGAIGAVGFALLYNIRGKKLVIACLGGLLSGTLFEIFNVLLKNEVLAYFIVSMMMAFYAEIMARSIKTPTTTFIATALIPLVPGRALYYTMAYAFEGNPEMFANNGLSTIKIASALALGIAVATATTRITHKLIEKKLYAKTM